MSRTKLFANASTVHFSFGWASSWLLFRAHSTSTYLSKSTFWRSLWSSIEICSDIWVSRSTTNQHKFMLSGNSRIDWFLCICGVESGTKILINILHNRKNSHQPMNKITCNMTINQTPCFRQWRHWLWRLWISCQFWCRYRNFRELWNYRCIISPTLCFIICSSVIKKSTDGRLMRIISARN